MGRSKHIDIVCVIALIAALVITVCMYAAGSISSADSDSTDPIASEQFTEADLTSEWDSASATYITLNGTTGKVTGNGAYIYNGNLYIVYAGTYVISGELSDGSVIVDADGDDDIQIVLNGVNLTCTDTAAFIVENADNVYLTLAEGTENTISDGDTRSESAEEDGVNGALFARDDLTINGSGSLTVTGNYRHGIVAKDDLVITGGTITVTAVEDAMHANDSVRIADADLTIDAGDDGITVSNDDATDYFYMESGTLTINSCYEGVEANAIYIEGGTITVYPSDDGFNATGSSGDGIIVNDGVITIINESGMDADGMDSNSSITINGGTVTISVPSDGSNTALDYGSENQGTLSLNGGTVIAAGSSSMLEEVSEESGQGFLISTETSGSAGSIIVVTDASGNTVLEAESYGSFSALILSSSGITNGDTYTISVDGTETEVTAGENSGSSMSMGGGGMNMGGGGMNMGGGHGGNTRDDSGSAESSIGDKTEDSAGESTDGDFTPPDGTEDGEFTLPDGTESGDMELPEDGEMPTMPDGTDSGNGQMPGGGMQMPGSSESGEMTLPDDAESGEMTPPDDAESGEMTLPENADGEMPSQSEDSESGEADADQRGQGGRDEQMMGPGMEDREDSEEETSSIGTATFVLIGISFIFILIGLLIAWRFKGKHIY